VNPDICSGDISCAANHARSDEVDFLMHEVPGIKILAERGAYQRYPALVSSRSPGWLYW